MGSLWRNGSGGFLVNIVVCVQLIPGETDDPKKVESRDMVRSVGFVISSTER